MRVKAIISVLMVSTMLVAATPTVAGASTLPAFLPPQIDYSPSPWQPVVRPTAIDLSTAVIAVFGAGHWIQNTGPSANLLWRTWNGGRARAQAVFFAGKGNGRISGYPCTLILSAPRRVHSHRVYTRWAIVFTHRLPPVWSGIWDGRGYVRWHRTTVVHLRTYRNSPEYS